MLAQSTDDVLFGEVRAREQSSPRDRSLVTVASLVTTGASDQLRAHPGIARSNGVTDEEISEVITHLAFYAGWPRAMAAVAVDREVRQSSDLLAAPRGEEPGLPARAGRRSTGRTGVGRASVGVALGGQMVHGGPVTTVVITGASRGMGAHAARHLAERGATVFAGARRPDELADQLRREGVDGDLRPLALDVTDDASVSAAMQQVEASVGSVDVLVNNAGVPGTWAAAADVGPEDFRDVFEVNVFAPVRVTRAFLPLLLRGERPRLVMVSSGMGSLALQSTDEVYADIAHLPYPGAKAALNMLTVWYAKALPQVLVTAVDPGLTATEFTGGSGHSVAEGAEAIITAVHDTIGPSGRFMDRAGAAPW